MLEFIKCIDDEAKFEIIDPYDVIKHEKVIPNFVDTHYKCAYFTLK